MNTYASLHNHTEYSNLKLIDSINRASELIDYAYELGLKAVAITDHDCVSGHFDAIEYFNEKYIDKDFKLILGNEIYLTRNDITKENAQRDDFHHFILLAKDKEGHHQLRELSSRAWKRSWMKGIQRTPTLLNDLFEVVDANPGHLIATTACIGGYIGHLWNLWNFNHGDELERMDAFLATMEDVFQGDFYIELQPSIESEDQINYNKFLVDRYWGKYKFTIATDSHYLKAEDREIHKWFLNSKNGDREVDTFYSSTYLMSADEVRGMMNYMSDADIDTLFQNTLNIAAQCENYSLREPQTVVQTPYDDMPDYRDFITDYEDYEYINYYATTDNAADKYFYNLICKGMAEKWKDDWDLDVYADRLNTELEAVYKISQKIGKSLADYFTTMGKFINIIWSRAESFIGPSRGSAGCFTINYFLGITQMNPLEQELKMPPWRFLHESRPELPDIDFDTESGKRQKVFNVIQEYMQSIGGDLVSVCTFGTEKTKSAIKTAGRGLNLSEETVAYLNSMIPNERGFDWTLDQCYYGDDDHPAIRNFKNEMDKYPMLWAVAHKIEGLITRLGCHASGVIAVNGSFVEHNSFMKTSAGQLVSAYELHNTEAMGYIKYDFLTVSTLDRIHQCFNYLLEDGLIEWQGSLRATYDKYLAPNVLELKDEKMWQLVADEKINALFQLTKC